MKRNLDQQYTEEYKSNNLIEDDIKKTKQELCNEIIQLDLTNIKQLNESIHIQTITSCYNETDITYLHTSLRNQIYNIEYCLNLLKQKEKLIKNQCCVLCTHTYTKHIDIYDSYYECSKCGDIK